MGYQQVRFARGFACGILPVAPPPVTTFDKYISPTGSDLNSGSLASPWAITSLRTVSANFSLINGVGLRIGLLPGNYDISGLMVSNSPDVGALQMPGGTASVVNYLGSSDAGGHYSPRTATIDMKGASGLYGGAIGGSPGVYDGPGIAHCGQYPTAYTISNLTIDGIRFTGFSFRGLDIGASYNADGPSGISNVLITNCEFYGGGFNNIGQVMFFTLTGGSGYVDGIYRNVPLTYVSGSTGSRATATITISGGTVTSVVIWEAGVSYVNGDVLSASAANLGGSVTSAFSITLTTVGTSANNSDNCAGLWIQGGGGVTVSNNWFHDTMGHGGPASADHLSAVIVWGPQQGPATTTYNTICQYNTCYKSGNIYGKEIAIEGTTCQYNYIDMSMYSTGSSGLQDFTGYNTGSLSRKSIFRNNIVLLQGNTTQGNVGFGWSTLNNAGTFTTPIEVYNNTVKCTTSSGPVVAWLSATGTNGSGNAKYYNNIYDNTGAGGSWNGFGNFRLTPLTLGLMNYNLVPNNTNCTWILYQDASPTTVVATYTSPGAFNTGLAANGGISGAEANTIQGAPIYTGTGLYAAQYKLTAGSNGHLAGRIGGVSGGGQTDMGAWGGIDVNTGSAPAQIGANFAV